MRLTLRTMLAYLDDLLEPEDRRAIGQKIDESEFATSLVHRSRDVVRRLRLGAPQVIGRGVGRDPNSVAEYLDNTMAPEQIQEFEKLCLESDINLAEVTSCHNILTMVLGEPAQIDASSRERMYRLCEGRVARVDQAAGPIQPAEEKQPRDNGQPKAAAAATAAVAAKPDEPAKEEQPGPARATEVPAYLREDSRSMFWPIALTALIAAGITGAILFALDGDNNTVAKKGEQTHKPEVAKSAKGTDTLPAVVQAPVAPQDIKPADTTDAPGVPPEIEVDPATLPPVIPEPPVQIAPPIDPEDAPAPLDARPSEVDVPEDRSPDQPPPTDLPADPAKPAEPAAPSADTPEKPAAPVAPTDDQLAKVDQPADPGIVTEPPPAQPSVVVGRLLSQDQVLLATATTRDQLRRLPPRASLNAGDKLVVLPTFRPMISIAATTIELDGGTMVELGAPDPDGVVEVNLRYGRLIARTLGMPNARIRLRMGEHQGVVRFGDDDSVFAAEVRPYRMPGSDPAKVPSTLASDLYVTSGSVTWTTADGEQRIEGPGRLVLNPHPADSDAATASLPKWLASVQVSALDQRAIPWIQDGVRSNRSVKLSLVELADHQRTEIRRLAYRCCSHIGYFEPLVSSLNDPDQRPRWHLYLDELSAAVARDPESAKAVFTALEKLRGDSALDLYRMLWGYSSTGLKQGGEARQLVDYLDREELDYRVMAFWNLQNITGMGLNYRPEYNEAKRRQSVLRWRNRLEDNLIAPEGAPAEPAPPQP